MKCDAMHGICSDVPSYLLTTQRRTNGAACLVPIWRKAEPRRQTILPGFRISCLLLAVVASSFFGWIEEGFLLVGWMDGWMDGHVAVTALRRGCGWDFFFFFCFFEEARQGKARQGEKPCVLV